MKTIKIKLPKKIKKFFAQEINGKSANHRYLVLKGGRGGGKSESIARLLIAMGYMYKIKILCTREVQNSIKDSVHAILKEIIESVPEFASHYIITDQSIKGMNGTQFIFKGLYQMTADSLKSLKGINIAWVEEAHCISRRSLELLTPTVREEGSFIVFSYNPENNEDPVHNDYVLTERDDTAVLTINYDENEFCPLVLVDEARQMMRMNPDKYRHVWLGETRRNTDAQIFAGCFSIEEFDEPDKIFPLFGLDWGFSQDPTAGIRCYIHDNYLYITHEFYGVGIELDDIPAHLDTLPDSRRYPIIADSARPESISHVKRRGFNVMPCVKGKGSVEDGIEFIKTFNKVIIHPRCKHTIDEFYKYSYVVDKRSGLISKVPEDKFNHIIDGLRYATNRYMKKSVSNNTIQVLR